MVAARVHAHSYSLHFADAFANARQAWQARQTWIVEVADGKGRCGYGEASPLPGRSRESAERVEQDFSTLAPIHLDAEQNAQALCAQLPATLSASARFALESALLDWWSKNQGKPLCDALSPESHNSLELSSLVNDPDPASWLDHIRRAQEQGYRCCKIKIGRDINAEVHAIRLIRRASSMRLRLDANRCLTLAQWRMLSAELNALGLDYVEEPVANPLDDALSDSSAFIALDETLLEVGIEPLRELLHRRPCKAIVIKPMLVGGVFASLGLAKMARELNIEVVYSHAFDGPIARAVSAHLALVSGSACAQGLAADAAMRAWPIDLIPDLGQRAEMNKPIAPGIGEVQWKET